MAAVALRAQSAIMLNKLHRRLPQGELMEKSENGLQPGSELAAEALQALGRYRIWPSSKFSSTSGTRRW